MRQRKILLALLLMLAAAQPISARTYHITLLTVGEIGDQEVGGTADAYLDVKPGTGRIFLDSFPLTKLDTQISTRYANKIACDYLDTDCSRYDFFYTIRADSTIVGGPSASGALTVLTIAALKNLALRNDTVMTGTINSGGSIGPVGGVPKKSKAAADVGFKRILIPLFSIDLEEENKTSNASKNNTSIKINISVNSNYTRQIDIGSLPNNMSAELPKDVQIIKIRNIDEALYYFTDRKINQKSDQIRLPDEYVNIMKNISYSLCDRAFDLKDKVVLNETDTNKTKEFLTKINNSLSQGEYYSAASYCFNLGVMLRKAGIKQIEANDPRRLDEIYTLTKRAVDEFDAKLENRTLTTIPQLETYIIVKERLEEARGDLEALENHTGADELAYAIERYYSAVFWSGFFAMPGGQAELDPNLLEEACYKKISEAEERINYANLYLPIFLSSSKGSIASAYEYALNRNYKMCLFKASYAKAESNLLLSSISVGTGQLNGLSEEKTKAARKLIAKEESRGFFPIMGYSYYEYADSLRRNGDSVSSLIFSEYTLELSNIEMYFPKRESFRMPNIDYGLLALILSVFALGLGFGMFITFNEIQRRSRAALPVKRINPKKTSVRGLPGKKR